MRGVHRSAGGVLWRRTLLNAAVVGADAASLTLSVVTCSLADRDWYCLVHQFCLALPGVAWFTAFSCLLGGSVR